MPRGIYKRTEKHKNGLKVPHKGSGIYKRTETHVKNMSKSRKGKPTWNKGTKGVCKPNSGSFKKGQNAGNKHPRWKGGISKRIFIRVNGGSHTEYEWENLKAQYNWTCPCCKNKEPFTRNRFKYLTKDHIIPVSKGGSDNIENIQPLCHTCNVKKYNKIIKKYE